MPAARVRKGLLPGLLVGMTFGLAGCGGSGAGLDQNGRPLDENPPSDQPLRPDIDSIQEHVFTPRCASCHAGATAPQGLRLEDAQTSYDNLVDVAAMQMPTTDRVEPGDADASYLIDKLEGTQVVGERMPRGQPPLDDETIAIIRQWIDEGAAPPGEEAAPTFLPAIELPAP